VNDTPRHEPAPDKEPLWIWVIYDHPRDFPNAFVARPQFETVDGIKQFGEGYAAPDLEVLRDHMRRMGLVCLARHPDDDPVIIEVWI
jgi:hypothetical protein